ncbi:ribonucleoside-diphosphate reductase subunit alpha [Oribacterium sinus]
MQTIIKRGLLEEDYQGEKIERAMEKAFLSEGISVEQEKLPFLLGKVEESLAEKHRVSVEEIQNAVEEALMHNGDYKVARAYILYREKRTLLRHLRQRIKEEIGDNEIDDVLRRCQKDFPDYDLARLSAKYLSLSKGEQELSKRLALLTRAAAELTTQEEPGWERIAGRLRSYHFHKELKKAEESRNLHSFYDKLVYLTEQGLYGAYILEHYSKEEVEELAKFIDQSRNDLFGYSGLDLLLSRYLIRDHQHVVLESPQEMYLGISMHLAMKEKVNRLQYVKEFYYMMRLHQVTQATPTQSHARKPYHQLSSCFIDTVPDSLDGIYQSISKFADVSKYGGGMGMYFGKVRSRGGKIRGFEGASGGVIRWIRVVNDTAVAVDQLGMRQGAVAVYLDAWHKDLPEFLQLKTNNGDDRMKAHDVFPAVCYPDLFWKKVKEDLNQEWYLMDPHDIFLVKGYCLEDFYGEEWESRYEDCVRDNRISKRVYVLKDLVRLILKSAVETGTPFAFYRDTVNRMNPNKHKGIIYCSNLCTEIAQNMKEAEICERKVVTKDGDEVIVSTVKPGDFVVCNLASLCLGNIPVENQPELERITKTVVRALDNVIDLNFYPVAEAEITNKRYRAIGLGVSGYHHMLAKHHIAWESQEHLDFVDKVFENINYAAIKASSELAKERGSYSAFAGSEWESGEYFSRRNYNSPRWENLKQEVHEGIRNAWILATAPTSSTSILIGTSAGLDPIMNRFFLEEKKGAILPRVAPELSMDTYWYYKSAHQMDQTWSVRAAGLRQRHIDQAQSFNFWITNEYKMSELLNLYTLAWECGVKTIYYVRSKALDPEDCESCSA